MSDWYPCIVRIESVKKHENADALSIVTTSLGDYPVITKLDEYKVGDLSIYIPIDTIVPDNDLFYFLCPKHDGAPVPRFEVGNVPDKYRLIKAKRIRKIYSQGLLIPIPAPVYQSILSEVQDVDKMISYPMDKILGLVKNEEDEEELSDPIEKMLKAERIKNKQFSQNDVNPSGWSMPYYDIDGMRKYVACIRPDEIVVLTEKIHGANAGFRHDGERLWVKSRNNFKRGEWEIPVYEDVSDISIDDVDWVLPADGSYDRIVKPNRKQVGTRIVQSTDQWWAVARKYDLASKLAKYPNYVFYGEVAGQISGFRYDAEIVDGKVQPNLYLFDIWDLTAQRYLDYDDRVAIILELGLTPVPELYRGPWLGNQEMYKYAEGKTTLGGKHVREGFVAVPVKERFEPRLNGRLQLKLVGEGYNLAK